LVKPEDDEEESLNILQGTLKSENEWLKLYPGKISIQVRTPSDAMDLGIKH
jgi:hypothetical protein